MDEHRCSADIKTTYCSQQYHVAMTVLLVRLTLVSLLLSPAVKGSLPGAYRQHRLDQLCREPIGTVNINLGKKPAVFLMPGSPDTHLECHLQLRSPSSQFGLYVFIEELKLNKTPDCSSDFLQFGR